MPGTCIQVPGLAFRVTASRDRSISFSIIPGAPEAIERLVEYSEVPAGLTKEQIFGPFLQPTSRIVSEPADADFQRAANEVNLWGVLYDALRSGRDIKIAMQELESSMYAIMDSTE